MMDNTRKKKKRHKGGLKWGTWNVNGWEVGECRADMRRWMMMEEKMDLVGIQEAMRKYNWSDGDGSEKEVWKRWGQESMHWGVTGEGKVGWVWNRETLEMIEEKYWNGWIGSI